ncbi:MULTISPECIES: threonine/serine exporter family protein [unclassified Isoptericola]|uniref:threonine/serine exporter family protein n=1 Tax=unclassified Isoptericola TaxID=2623355 RepID=UPI003667484D
MGRGSGRAWHGESQGTGGAYAFGQLGALLLEAGLSVTDVRLSLERAQREQPDAAEERLRFDVLPDVVLVSRDATGEVTLVGTQGDDLSFRQAAHAGRLAREVESGAVRVDGAAHRIEAIRRLARPHASAGWVLGSAAVAVGLAVVFRCPWWAVVVSVLTGALVGILSLLLRRLDGATAVVPFLVALVSTTGVGAVASALDLGPVPLFAVCAPVAVLVPGALVTNALLELTASDIVTGAGRLAYGVIVLGMMAVGISAGSALTGLTLDPSSAALVGDVRSTTADAGGWLAIPPQWASWAGVVVLAIGVGLAFGSGRRLTVLNVGVMTCTFALLSVLSPWIGPEVAAGVTAALLFVTARLIEQGMVALPSAATFQPAFLLLVPGTVGLVALASTDLGSLESSLMTFVSLCLGVKIGALLADATVRGRPAGAVTDEPGAGSR